MKTLYLEKLYKDLQQKKIIRFSDDDDNWNDWLGELIFFDSTIAGLAASAIGGAKIRKVEIPEIYILNQSFSKLFKNEINEDKINYYLDYLNTVNKTHEELIKIAI